MDNADRKMSEEDDANGLSEASGGVSGARLWKGCERRVGFSGKRGYPVADLGALPPEVIENNY